MTTETAQSPAHSRITITASDGRVIEGTWAKRSGGNTTSEERRYHEGGVYEEEVAGGPSTQENMTLSRPYKKSRDIELYRWARRVAGKIILTITEQPLDDDGNAYGQPLVDTARLLGVTRPEVDADDTGGTSYIELSVSPYGALG